MPSPLLDNLVQSGLFRPEPPTQAEFDGLERSGRVRLTDAANCRELSLESRFDLAYSAARALGLAALRWHGYRSQNHYQGTTHTLGLEATQWQVLDQARSKHELAKSEGDIDLDVAMVDELIRVTQIMAERVAVLGPVPKSQ